MSLFDILRYPISDKPTAKQLEALPKDLFDAWISQTEWHKPKLLKGPTAIGRWYEQRNYLMNRDKEEVSLLKQMIKNHEPI